MFIGNPPGNHDRILDFSTAVTGNLFFVPTDAAELSSTAPPWSPRDRTLARHRQPEGGASR